MATDFLSSLRDYHANGGRDINEFLSQHTVSKDPANVAARIAAADAASRLTGGPFQSSTVAPAGGNVLTGAQDLPPGAEGTYFGGPLANPPRPSPTPGTRSAEADVPPGAGGTYYGGPLANPANPSPTPIPPRRLAPNFNVAGATAPAPAQPTGEVPWWQRSSFTPEFQSFIDQSKRSTAGAGQVYAPGGGSPDIRGGGIIRINRNTYIPQSVNYNSSSSL